MSYVIAAPGMMAATATDVAAVGSNLSAAHMAAAAPTVAVIPAAADEVSAGIAHLFSRYAQGYQALAGQAAVFHEQFVQNLTAGAGSYAATETANSSLLPLNAAAATSLSIVPIIPISIQDEIIALLRQILIVPILPITDAVATFFGNALLAFLELILPPLPWVP